MANILDLATSTQTIIAQYVVQPLIILFLGIFFGKLLEQAVVFLAKELKRDSPEVRFSARVTAWGVYLVAVALALHTLGVLSEVLFILGSIALLIVTLSLVLGLKDFFPNALAHARVKKRYKEGSIMKTAFGDLTVVQVQLIDTHCKNSAGDDIYFPNRSVPVGKNK